MSQNSNVAYGHIASEVLKFKGVSLVDMDKVSLMNRTDTKYVIAINQLKEILQKISSIYFVLEINNERMLPYRTTYYDTEDFNMFRKHHSGRLNRYKVREREYLNTETAFLEVKFKNNKRMTLKKRILREKYNSAFTDENRSFIAKVSPFSLDNLVPKVENHFTRMTFVHPSFTERVTIDINLAYKYDNKKSLLDKLSIIEIKRDKHSVTSDLSEVLNAARIFPSRMSKYCIGASLIHPHLKQNNFKPKIRKLSKISGCDIRNKFE